MSSGQPTPEIASPGVRNRRPVCRKRVTSRLAPVLDKRFHVYLVNLDPHWAVRFKKHGHAL